MYGGDGNLFTIRFNVESTNHLANRLIDIDLDDSDEDGGGGGGGCAVSNQFRVK